MATWAAHEGFGQRDRELSADRRDRVFDVSFGSDRRRLWVLDGRVTEPSGDAWGLRGESPLVRGSGSHKQRCTVLRDDENLAIPALRNERGRVRFSVPRSRARCANAVSPCRPAPRGKHFLEGSKASISLALSHPRAIR